MFSGILNTKIGDFEKRLLRGFYTNRKKDLDIEKFKVSIENEDSVKHEDPLTARPITVIEEPPYRDEDFNDYDV